jgi:hypothetical protein
MHGDVHLLENLRHETFVFHMNNANIVQFHTPFSQSLRERCWMRSKHLSLALCGGRCKHRGPPSNAMHEIAKEGCIPCRRHNLTLHRAPLRNKRVSVVDKVVHGFHLKRETKAFHVRIEQVQPRPPLFNRFWFHI